jgi:PQQ-like domain
VLVGPSLVVFGGLAIDGGATLQRLLAVNAVTGAPIPWAPTVAGSVNGIAADNGTLFVLFGEAAGPRRVMAFDGATGAVLWTSAALSATVGPMVVTGSRLIVALDRLYSLDPATGVIDTAWGGPADTSTQLSALEVTGQTLYVGGNFSTFHGQPRANLAAVDRVTGALLPWAPQASALIDEMVASPGGGVFVTPLVSGASSAFTVNGQSRQSHVMEIDATGTVTSWSAQALFAPQAMHEAASGTLLFGSSGAPTTGTLARTSLAGFDTTTGTAVAGTPAIGHSAGAPAVNAVVSVGQTLFISGVFDTVNGHPRVNLAALDTASNVLLPWPAAGVPATMSIVLAHDEWIYAYPDPLNTATPLRRIHASTGVLDPVFEVPRVQGVPLAFAIDHGRLYIGTFFPGVRAQGPRLVISVLDTATDTLRVLSSFPASREFAVDGDTVYVAAPTRTSADVVGTVRAYDLRTGHEVSAPTVTGQLNGVTVADGRLFVFGGTFVVGATTRSGVAEITRPAGASAWDAGTWHLATGLNLSLRGVVSVSAYGDLLVAHGLTRSHARLAAFPLSGASVPSNLRSQIAGANTVFTWDAMVPPPAGGYVIEGGFAAGQTAGALAVGNATSVALPMPAGPAFIRVRPQGSTEVSNEIVAGCFAPPRPPTALTTTLNGTALSLTWAASADPSTSYTLHAGTAAGLSDAATVPLPGTQTSISGIVPGGTFFARVTAANACGESGPSGEVFFTIGAPDALPAAPTNVVATLSGMYLLTLSWTAPPGPVIGYVLEGGSGLGLANFGALQTGPITSITLPFGIPSGTHYVRVRAITSAGSGAPSADVVAVVP